MKGRRVYEKDLPEYEPGDYGRWKHELGVWVARTPNGYCACLVNHQVVEHEDKTITVSPSIAVSGGGPTPLYHGWLERGVWREA